MTSRLTDRDLRTINTALAMIAAGEWDDGSYGRRPDFEATQERVHAEIDFRENARAERRKSLAIERRAKGKKRVSCGSSF